MGKKQQDRCPTCGKTVMPENAVMYYHNNKTGLGCDLKLEIVKAVGNNRLCFVSINVRDLANITDEVTIVLRNKLSSSANRQAL